MSDRVIAHQCDYAVVGGGPVGAVMALGLAAQGHRVALIERDAPLPESALVTSEATNALGVDPRTVALSVSSQTLLEEQGAWPERRIGAFEHMEVWEDRGTSVLRFGAADIASNAGAQDVLGHIAEVGPWRAQLWQMLAASDVELFTGVSVTAVTADTQGSRVNTSGYRLTFADPGQETGLEQDMEPGRSAGSINARTLIAADGANSIVRRALRVPMTLADTGQSALAFAARTSAPHEHTAFQRFLQDGPLALLPMADEHLVSIVWSARNARADELAGLSLAALQGELERASERRLGAIEQVIAPVRFPLRQGVISHFCPAPNLVFIGDAARVVHPLAGQGVNLGFEDVRALLLCTEPAVCVNAVPTASRLQRFARLRRARSRLAVNAMSALSQAYAGQSPGMLWARNTATRALASWPLLRRQLVLEAMGLGPVARSS